MNNDLIINIILYLSIAGIIGCLAIEVYWFIRWLRLDKVRYTNKVTGKSIVLNRYNKTPEDYDKLLEFLMEEYDDRETRLQRKDT